MRDTALVLGATMRLTRLVVTDDLGQWWFRDPAYAWAATHGPADGSGWRAKLVSGLDCPFCVGFWLGTAVLASHRLAGGTGWWRFAAAALTLNEVAGHLGARLGDVADEE